MTLRSEGVQEALSTTSKKASCRARYEGQRKDPLNRNGLRLLRKPWQEGQTRMCVIDYVTAVQ